MEIYLEWSKQSKQENMRGKKGTLPVMALWYVIVGSQTEVCFRDVRIKTKVST